LAENVRIPSYVIWGQDVSSIFYYEIEERLPYLGSNREKNTYT